MPPLPTPERPLHSPRDLVDQTGLNRLVDNLNRNHSSLEPADRSSLDSLNEALTVHLDELKTGIKYLTDNQGRNLEKMRPDHIELIIDVIANNPAEAERLKAELRRGNFELLAKEIEKATKNNPEKLIEIAEIMLMDASIPDELKRSLHKSLLEINRLLRPLTDLGEKYALVTPEHPYGAPDSGRREEFAKEIGRFIFRRFRDAAENMVEDLIRPDKEDLQVRIDRQEKLQIIRTQIEHNRMDQGELRQKMFLIPPDNKEAYRDCARALVNLVADEKYLKVEEEKYAAFLN